MAIAEYEPCALCGHEHFRVWVRMETFGKLHPPVFHGEFEKCTECQCEFDPGVWEEGKPK